MNDILDQYHEYVITSFVKAIQPVVVAWASRAIITDLCTTI